MKRKPSRARTDAQRKPTPAQLRDVEYGNEVRHLASSELQYRMNDNSAKAERLRLDIVELDAKRKYLSADLATLDRQRAVLHSVFSARLAPVTT